tara:strand:+ start:756 stop:1742 length:987 start_codon:yes stop_codon:yes gene_type:complete
MAGGIVRSTGSGMGCPDWPKCFGKIIPPTHISELSDNYKDKFVEKRKKKNTRLSKYLSYFGFNELSQRLLDDKSIYVEEDFNVYKTWTEYLNRLLGAIVGLSIFLTFLSSINFIKIKKIIFFVSFSSLILVLFQAWLGSIVVSTKLMPGIISLHMIVALLIISLMIYTYFLSKKNKFFLNPFLKKKEIKFLIILNLIAMFFQIILGSQVRESIDQIAIIFGENLRNTWIANLGIEFIIHRSFSLFILALNLYLVYLLLITKDFLKSNFKIVSMVLFLIILEILSGAGMAYFAIPSYLQPVHLLIAFLIFGLLFYLYLLVDSSTKNENF